MTRTFWQMHRTDKSQNTAKSCGKFGQMFEGMFTN